MIQYDSIERGEEITELVVWAREALSSGKPSSMMLVNEIMVGALAVARRISSQVTDLITSVGPESVCMQI